MNNTQTKMLEEYTFGKEKADITLVKILNSIGNVKLSRYVGNQINDSKELAKRTADKLGSICDNTFMYKLLKDHYHKKIETDKMPRLYPEIQTYLKNVITRNIKIELLRRGRAR